MFEVSNGLAISALWTGLSYASMIVTKYLYRKLLTQFAGMFLLPVLLQTVTCFLFSTLFTTLSVVLTFVLHAVYLAP